jgi:hypothetical protein
VLRARPPEAILPAHIGYFGRLVVELERDDRLRGTEPAEREQPLSESFACRCQ